MVPNRKVFDEFVVAYKEDSHPEYGFRVDNRFSEATEYSLMWQQISSANIPEGVNGFIAGKHGTYYYRKCPEGNLSIRFKKYDNSNQ